MADLLSDGALRLSFDDLQRLEIASGFEEIRFGLLRLALGPGFASVSSARLNLERFYGNYKATSQQRENTIIELWKDGAKIGEVTGDGVMVGPEFKVTR
jgi:hypothetical protein